jgi:hypothetical protein
MKPTLPLALATSMVCAPALSATTIFTLSDTTDSVFEHDSDGTNSPSPIPLAGSSPIGNGEFAWEDLATDTTPNTAVFSSGTFAASDWGGVGTFTSNTIDITSFSSIDINAQFDGLFNTGTESSNFFYQLDAGPVVDFGVGLEDVTYTDEVVSVTGIPTGAATSLTVGFTFNHNGSSDFFNVDSFTVTGVPEPSAAVLGGFGLLGLLRRRR